ncbi:MAG: hypothetical protein ACSHXW_16335, partial [Yoonia sp.]
FSPIVSLLWCSKCYQRSGIKPRQVHIESPDIQITERGDEGGWTTIDNDEGVVLDLTTYDRSDAGLFVEGTFSGNPDYWPVIYKKPQERGPTKEVSGRFSIFFPIE